MTLGNTSTYRTMITNGVTASRTKAPPPVAHSTLDHPVRVPGRKMYALTSGPAVPPRHVPLPIIVLFHGGGNILGYSAVSEASARSLAATYNFFVVLAYYRLASERHCPAVSTTSETC